MFHPPVGLSAELRDIRAILIENRPGSVAIAIQAIGMLEAKIRIETQTSELAEFRAKVSGI